jgi:DNA polymerase I-like protein with 3'-5' exonuclease and polymerase domains
MISPENIVTLDFETYYDKDYSLSKLSTSEYIRDERFKAQCVGIKQGTEDVVWVPDRHVEEALRCVDWASSAVLAHHTQFDGFILTDVFGLYPAYYLDTLSMGRALHSVGLGASLDALAKFYGLGNKTPDVLGKTKGVRDIPPELMAELGLYCAVDTQLCFDLFNVMKDQFPQSELDLINETCRMFCRPVLQVDIPRAQKALESEKDNKAKKVLQAEQDPANLRSNVKFADVLRGLGVEPPTKISPTTEKTTYAFSKSDLDFQKLMEHEDEAVRTVVAARMAVKSTLNETRAQRLINEGAGGRPVPVYLRYYGAHTGRWSAGNKMNFQNLPRGGELRKSLLAPDGYVLVVADSAQIEPRMLGWLCDDEELLQQFRDEEDVYIAMASAIYNVPPEDITPSQRFVGKVAVLGLGYGMGWKRFMLTLELGLMGPKTVISEKEAINAVNTYRMERSVVVDFWDKCTEMLTHMMNDMDMEYKCLRVDGKNNRIYLPNGMYLEYPGLCYDNDGFRYFTYAEEDAMQYGRMPTTRGKKMYGGILAENINQALARIPISDQLLVTTKRYPVLTTTHDELVGLAPEPEAPTALEFMLDTMRTPPPWAPELPLNAEGGYAREYSK